MSRYIVFLLTFLTLIPARANLGENVKQLITRYGTPVNFSEPTQRFPFGTVVFSASGITLVVYLLGEKEVGARVSKTNTSAFTDAERDGIMNADTGGSHWVSTPSTDPNTLQWSRSDNATVMYDKGRNILIFTSDEMAKALQAAQTVPDGGPAPATAPTAPASTAPTAPAVK